MSEYLKFRFEQRRLSRERPDWLEHFKSVCWADAKESDFLAGDEADALRGAFYGKLRSGAGLWSAAYDTEDPSETIELLSSLGRDFQEERAVLLETGVGAIEGPVRALLTCAAEIWRPAKSDFCVVTRDMRNGLCAERNLWQGSGARHDNPYFEIHAWGAFVP